MSTLARIDAPRRAAKLAETLEPGAPRSRRSSPTRAPRSTTRAGGEARRRDGRGDDPLAAKLEERSVALGQLGDNAADVGATARALNDETLPRLNAPADDLRRRRGSSTAC
jgi:hypothetical protein